MMVRFPLWRSYIFRISPRSSNQPTMYAAPNVSPALTFVRCNSSMKHPLYSLDTEPAKVLGL